jgi:hypothetical protein
MTHQTLFDRDRRSKERPVVPVCKHCGTSESVSCVVRSGDVLHFSCALCAAVWSLPKPRKPALKSSQPEHAAVSADFEPPPKEIGERLEGRTGSLSSVADDQRTKE